MTFYSYPGYAKVGIREKNVRGLFIRKGGELKSVYQLRKVSLLFITSRASSFIILQAFCARTGQFLQLAKNLCPFPEIENCEFFYLIGLECVSKSCLLANDENKVKIIFADLAECNAYYILEKKCLMAW